MDIALAFILFTLNFLLGYYLGQKSHASDNNNAVGDLFTAISKKIAPKTRLGAIHRPTASQVYRKANPVQKETEEEMRRALDDLQKEEE